MSVLVRRPVRLCRLPPSALLLCTGINAIYWLVVFVFFTTGIFISLSSPSVVLLPSLSVLLTGISMELSPSETLCSCSLFLLCSVNCFLLQHRSLIFASFKLTDPRLLLLPFSLCASKISRSFCIFYQMRSSQEQM